MRKQFAVVALLFLGSMGCTDDAAESEPLIILDAQNNVVAADNNMQVEPTPPQYYSARLAGVLAGPGKVDDTPWDGTGSLAQSLVELAASLTGYPVLESKAVVELAQQFEQALAKPDITAEITLIKNGYSSETEIVILDQDNFLPTFTQPPILGDTFHGANGGVFGTAQIVFIDRDIANDDTMGLILLSQEDMELVISEGNSAWLNVSDQTYNQILAVRIVLYPINTPSLL
jgi:hypothetical protein